MADTATMTPTTVVGGTVVAVEAKPYDFEDGNGQRNTGTSYRLHLLTQEAWGNSVASLKLAQQIGSEAVSVLKPGASVQAHGTGFARVKGKRAVIEYTFRDIVDAKTGDFLIRQD